jgi:hypothetical protein
MYTYFLFLGFRFEDVQTKGDEPSIPKEEDKLACKHSLMWDLRCSMILRSVEW